jgi:hypothetical protein
MARDAIRFWLSGWDTYPEARHLLPYWRGVLPLKDIAALYR